MPLASTASLPDGDTAHPGDAAVDARVDVPVVSALEAVQNALAALAVVPGEEGAWLPARLLGLVASATGDLPAPTPPRFHGDQVTWGLLALPGADPVPMARACTAIVLAEPRVACATDTTEWAGAERTRVVLGWRVAPGHATVTLVQPLRALSRLAPTGTCLVSAQRTLRTLDLTVRVTSGEALGRLLAVATAAPALSDLIVVRTDPHGAQTEALFSWPLDRADTTVADMADDPWPARCDGASTTGQDAPAHTVPVARMYVRGTRAHGAVLTAVHRDWLVTAGDTVAAVTVVDTDERGVTARLAPRPRPVRLSYVHGP